MNVEQIKDLEDLCVQYIPNRHLGDMLPANITMEVIKSYTCYLSRLNDSDAKGHLRCLGVSKQRARDFVEQRNRMLGLNDKVHS